MTARLLALAIALVAVAPGVASAQSVLVIYDLAGLGTTDLTTALTNAGYAVTLSTTSESSYDGTNPAPGTFDAVIHMNGTTYAAEMPIAGQNALVSYVNAGGGFIHHEWNAYQIDTQNQMVAMTPITILQRSSGATATQTVTETSAGSSHPVMANVPTSWTTPNMGHNIGGMRSFSTDPPVSLATDSAGNVAVAARDMSAGGRIVGLHTGGNYFSAGTGAVWANTNYQQLMIDAVLWVSDGYCVDVDADTFCADQDCNDLDATVYPGAPEGCDLVDTDCDGVVPTAEVDDDGDGQPECLGDCDDADATSFLGANEACDLVDNDCDGVLPPDESDVDNDGVAECFGDCDDVDASVFPGNSEVCDGEDNDCDPLTDYVGGEGDVDGDGVITCADCDDGDATVLPNAPELCDGLDNDCDGVVPPDEADLDVDTWAECEGDCNDNVSAINPDALEDCFDGIDNNCNSWIDSSDPSCGSGDDDDSTGDDDDDDDDDDTGDDDDDDDDDTGDDDDDSAGDDDTGFGDDDDDDGTGTTFGCTCASSAADGKTGWLSLAPLLGLAWVRRRR